MSAAQAQDHHWTRRFWVFCFLAAIAAQALLIVWLSDNRQPSPRGRAEATHVRLVSRPSRVPGKATDDMLDPTVFALVTPNGFSRAAWLTVAPHGLVATNAGEPVRWLSLDPDELASDFAEFVQTNLLAGDIVVNELPAPLAQPALITAVFSRGTSVRIEGALAKRSWRCPLPAPRYPEPILANTVIRVIVDATGRTISAALLSTNGVPVADQGALAYVRAIQFSPALAQGLQSGPEVGEVIFEWSRCDRNGGVERSTTTASSTREGS